MAEIVKCTQLCPYNTLNGCKKEDGICVLGKYSGGQDTTKDYNQYADYSGAGQSDLAKAINGMFHDETEEAQSTHDRSGLEEDSGRIDTNGAGGEKNNE